jgi:Phage integrase, N-terminal SAM-like domain
MSERASQLSLVQKTEKDFRVGKSYRYEFWHVQGTDLDGKRIRKKFATREDALDWKNLKEIELLNGGRKLHSVITVLSEQQLKEAEGCFSRLGERYTLTQAVDHFFRDYREPDFRISLSDASVKFRGAMEGQIRDRSLVQLKSTLGQFERFADNCQVHEVTPALVERFLKSLRAKNGTDTASRKTWNNYRGDLHQFFEWCSKKPQRYIPENPVAEVKRHEIDRGHIEVLTLDRCRELMKYVSEFKEGKLVPYFALALFGGVRPGGELEKLADNQQLVDLKNKVIRITEAISKTGKPRQVKIRPSLRKWLERFSGEIIPINSDRELKAVRAKFTLGHDVCRHTFISMHIGAFKSFADAAIESGNSEKIIRDHYLNTSAAAEAKAFWRLEPASGREA